MRVVQLCESFSPFSETFIYDTVQELNRQKVECHVVTLNRINKSERQYDEEKTHVTPWPSRWNLARIWARTLATLGIRGDISTHKTPLLRDRIRKALECINPDVVHAQFGPMGTLVAPLTDELDISLVVTFHGYDISILPQQKEIRDGYRDLFKRADCLIGVSNHNADKVKALGAPDEKVCTLHNGTNVKNFNYSNPSDRFEGKTVQLLFVGRLVKVKSPVRLVESFAKAKQKVTNDINLHLTIAGNGPEYEAVQSRARELAVNESVTCLGAIPHKEVRRLMQSCHVYVQHSKKTASGAEEGQGVTFIEAQASGMPVVATRSGGIPDVVIDGETGYLVKEGDTEAMAERIVRLAQHPETWGKMGHAGRVHVEEQFSLSKQVTKLINIYKSVI